MKRLVVQAINTIANALYVLQSKLLPAALFQVNGDQSGITRVILTSNMRTGLLFIMGIDQSRVYLAINCDSWKAA